MSARKEFSSLIPTPCSSTGMADQFMVTDWNPLVSMDNNVDFDGSSSSIMVERFLKPSAFANDRFPENSFDLRKTTSIVPSALCVPHIHSTERNLKGKKRKPESGSLNQNVEAEQKKNVSPDSVESPKPKSENSGGSSHMLAPKEDYIHVRAKRGQATNSHSLAERVRREKISERMRLLQDLVPGCNKITGKAMMLDEIINYVQSLQRQVEFLSMKLAAVNPELDFDIEQVVSKDMFPSRSGGLPAFEISSGMNTLHPHFLGSSPHGIMQSEMLMSDLHNSANMLRSTISQLPVVWDEELHNALQMGFIPNPALVGSDPNDSMKI